MSNLKRKKRNLLQWIIRILTGYEITVISILLLIAIVFFSTLEQADVGLYTVKQRYYAIDVFLVQPELRGQLLPILLPGAYWVCAIFTLNLLCGGVTKMAYLFAKNTRSTVPFEKRFGKFIGVFTSHISMAVLMIAGAVDYHKSSMTMLDVVESETNHIGVSEEDIVIEVSEIVDGVETDIHVVENKHISGMILNGKTSWFDKRGGSKTFEFDHFPFKIKFKGWYRNANVIPAKVAKIEGDGETIDGLYVREDDILTLQESSRIGNYNQSVDSSKRKKSQNMGAAYLEVINEAGKSQTILVATSFTEPGSSFIDAVTLNIADKTYGFKLTQRVTLLPFKISLKELDVNTYQGTTMARDYISNIVYEYEGEEVATTISMNKPLRKEGYTVYQARWQAGQVDMSERKEYVDKRTAAGLPLDLPEEMRLVSIYQVVSNPADRWPEFCIYISGIGLLFHFGLKLSMFVWSSFNKEKKNEI